MKPLMVIGEVYTSFMIEKVFPGIRSNFHIQRHIPILVQHYNAGRNIHPKDPDIITAGLPQNDSPPIRMYY